MSVREESYNICQTVERAYPSGKHRIIIYDKIVRRDGYSEGNFFLFNNFYCFSYGQRTVLFHDLGQNSRVIFELEIGV